MKILALETSTMAGGIALVEDGVLIGEVRVNVHVAHSERLFHAVDWLLQSSGVSIKEIDAFAVSIGPGSFTGLRIGLSTVKGLAYTSGKPVVPVPTLDAFAMGMPFCAYLVCPMLDARKNEVYTALYEWGNGVCTKIIPETVTCPEDFLEKIKQPAVFMGDGAKNYKNIILQNLNSNAHFAPSSKMSPSASGIAEIALERLQEGIVTDTVTLAPLYIRKSEAEIRWKN